MTTWTTISDSALTQDKPLTQSIMRALRDNISATAEGASGAPAVVYGALDTFLETAGGVGSLAVAGTGGGITIAFGGTTAGSNLQPASCGGTRNGVALSGTWYCLGAINPAGTLGNRVTLFIRIA